MKVKPLGPKTADLKVGDRVTRMLAGQIPMTMTVTAVDDKFVHSNDWKFLRANGAEVDEEIGWDGIHSTGSFLVEGNGGEKA